jgi:hypothetical protein
MAEEDNSTVVAGKTLASEAPKRLRAWLVDVGFLGSCVMIKPIWVVKVDRVRGVVKWRFPGCPYDVARTAPFVDVHSTMDRALEHAGRLLCELGKEPPNVLQQ